MASETSNASHRGRLREGTDKRGYASTVEAAGALLADDSHGCAKPPSQGWAGRRRAITPCFPPFLGECAATMSFLLP